MLEDHLGYVVKDYTYKIDKALAIRKNYIDNQIAIQKKLIKLDADILLLISNRQNTINSIQHELEDKPWIRNT